MNNIAISFLLCGLLICIISMLYQGIDNEKSFVMNNKINTTNKNKAYSIISLVCIIYLIFIGTGFGIIYFTPNSDYINVAISSFCIIMLIVVVPMIPYWNMIK